MLPLHDDNPTHRFAIVTVVIIALNVLIFVYQSSKPDPQSGTRATFEGSQTGMVCTFGVMPDRIVDGELEPIADPSEAAFADFCADANAKQPRATSLITHQFMHGGWLHLLGNMLFLWIFGNNVEDRLGRIRFPLFYLLCGIIAAVGQIIVEPNSIAMLIGASGAISGVLGAYFLLYPKARVLALVAVVPLRLPAWVVLGAYIAFQFLYVSRASGTEGGGGVAYWAHIVGFIAGLVLVLPFLIGRPRRPPPQPRLS